MRLHSVDTYKLLQDTMLHHPFPQRVVNPRPQVHQVISNGNTVHSKLSAPGAWSCWERKGGVTTASGDNVGIIQSGITAGDITVNKRMCN